MVELGFAADLRLFVLGDQPGTPQRSKSYRSSLSNCLASSTPATAGRSSVIASSRSRFRRSSERPSSLRSLIAWVRRSASGRILPRRFVLPFESDLFEESRRNRSLKGLGSEFKRMLQPLSRPLPGGFDASVSGRPARVRSICCAADQGPVSPCSYA